MLSIGEFAQMADLTVKALRHYDERGLLVPARVDPETRHRTYAGTQLRDAVTIKALRAADVPVPVVHRVLDDPDGSDAVLAEFRERVAAERVAQDAALDAARQTLTDLAAPVAVDERDAPIQHWAAVVQQIDEADAGSEEATDRADRGFATLFTELTRRGNPPDGPFWSSFGAGATAGTAELILCWPVARPAPATLEVDGQQVRVGTLPPRRELVARWMHSSPSGPGSGPAHPALVALLAELESRGRGSDLAGVRQIAIMGDEGPVGIELAVAVG